MIKIKHDDVVLQEALNLAIKNESWEHALILDSFFRRALCVPAMAR